MESRESIIQRKSFEFSIPIVRIYQWICENHKIHILAHQVLRSGTSIGANVEEAEGALIKKEFTAKIGVAYKEVRETCYWLKLLSTTGYLDDEIGKSMLTDCAELVKILGAIQKTAQENLANENSKK